MFFKARAKGLMLVNASAATRVKTIAITRLRREGNKRLCFVTELAELCWMERVDAHAKRCAVAKLTNENLVALCRKQAAGAA